MTKSPKFETLTLDTIVGGGQAIGTLADGRKAFVWGGLPGEQVIIRLTKTKSHFVEAIVTEVITASPERIAPQDPETYLSTSPWQIMDFAAEQHHKAQLIAQAFQLHHVTLPQPARVYTNNQQYGYRNKVEFSWYSTATLSGDTLDLAFFRRGSKGKVIVNECALLPQHITILAVKIRDYLRAQKVSARELKTLLIRCDQNGNCVWQLYVKDQDFAYISEQDASNFGAQGGEVIYSDPKSPASRITKRLLSVGDTVLTDTILGIPFRYATEGFFQVNIPVYEQALGDMKAWVSLRGVGSLKEEDGSNPSRALSSEPERAVLSVDTTSEVQPDPLLPGAKSGPARNGVDTETAHSAVSGKGDPKVLDLYSGVGTIGLTIGGNAPELVEINADAVREMERNIKALGSNAAAILTPSEKALDYITGDKLIIVDPPRAGLHKDVVNRLLETTPQRIIYLSCNPITQARDVSLLSTTYKIVHHQGYNFFPRTPHIEHLIILDLI